MTKTEIFCNLQYIFFINFTNIWFYSMIKCKFCNKIIIVTYFNDYFGKIIQFYSFLIFDFGPHWNTNIAGSTPSYMFSTFQLKPDHDRPTDRQTDRTTDHEWRCDRAWTLFLYFLAGFQKQPISKIRGTVTITKTDLRVMEICLKQLWNIPFHDCLLFLW